MIPVIAKGKTAEKKQENRYHKRNSCKERGVRAILEHVLVLQKEGKFRQETYIESDHQAQNSDVPRKFPLFKNSGEQCAQSCKEDDD